MTTLFDAKTINEAEICLANGANINDRILGKTAFVCQCMRGNIEVACFFIG